MTANKIRATRQKIPLNQQAGSPSNPARQALARYFMERMARFTKLYEHDPIADFFQLGHPQCQLTPNAHPEILALVDHPCRGCPHLTLAYSAGQNPTKGQTPPEPAAGHRPKFGNNSSHHLTPTEKVGTTMPKPLCTAYPECKRNPISGHVSVTYKETWYRCPLYGVNYLQDALNQIRHELDEIRAEVRAQSSAALPSSSSSQNTKL